VAIVFELTLIEYFPGQSQIAAAVHFPSLKQDRGTGIAGPDSESIFHRMLSPAASSAICCFMMFPSYSTDKILLRDSGLLSTIFLF